MLHLQIAAKRWCSLLRTIDCHLSFLGNLGEIHFVLFLAGDALFEVCPPVYSQMTFKILSSNINRALASHHSSSKNPVDPYPIKLGGSNNIFSKHVCPMLQSYKPLLIYPTAETWAFLHLFSDKIFLPVIALFSLEKWHAEGAEGLRKGTADQCSSKRCMKSFQPRKKRKRIQFNLILRWRFDRQVEEIMFESFCFVYS